MPKKLNKLTKKKDIPDNSLSINTNQSVKNQFFDSARAISLNILSQIQSYQETIHKIKELADKHDVPPIVKLQAQKTILQEFQALRTFEFKNPLKKDLDINDLSEQEINDLLKEIESNNPDIINGEFTE